MNGRRKNRLAFRPSVGDASLEDRLVLATNFNFAQGVPFQVFAASLRTPSRPASTPAVVTVAAARSNVSARQSQAQALLTQSQVHTAFAQQQRAAFSTLQQAINI